jgi:hypothetical protein
MVHSTRVNTDTFLFMYFTSKACFEVIEIVPSYLKYDFEEILG